MKIIAHRKNTIRQLLETDKKYGIEVDIRSEGNQLITHHDPFSGGDLFEDWIKNYKHGTLILNVKEEGLESRIISLMKREKIDDYFFLDQSFPFLIKWANLGETKCAARVSEFESIETALTLAGKIKWIWVDCFTRFPLSYDGYLKLKNAGFNLCIVSPELQGRDGHIEIREMKELLSTRNILPDAVCTKFGDLWEKSDDA